VGDFPEYETKRLDVQDCLRAEVGACALIDRGFIVELTTGVALARKGEKPFAVIITHSVEARGG